MTSHMLRKLTPDNGEKALDDVVEFLGNNDIHEALKAIAHLSVWEWNISQTKGIRQWAGMDVEQ